MIGYLPFLLWFVLLLFSLLDIDRTPDGAARRMSTGGWFLVVLVVPIVGAIAWLTMGRPRPVAGAAIPAGVPIVAGSGDITPPIERIPAREVQPDDNRLQAILDRIDHEFDEAVRRSRERRRGGGTSDGRSDRR